MLRKSIVSVVAVTVILVMAIRVAQAQPPVDQLWVRSRINGAQVWMTADASNFTGLGLVLFLPNFVLRLFLLGFQDSNELTLKTNLTIGL